MQRAKSWRSRQAITLLVCVADECATIREHRINNVPSRAMAGRCRCTRSSSVSASVSRWGSSTEPAGSGHDPNTLGDKRVTNDLQQRRDLSLGNNPTDGGPCFEYGRC